MNSLEDFDFELPGELIAQEPLVQRDRCRLLVIDRQSGSLTHHRFDEIVTYLSPGDCLVLNDTRVIPARFRAVKSGTGGSVEILFVEKAQSAWHCLLNPSRRLRVGLELHLPEDPAIRWTIGGTQNGQWVLQPGFPAEWEPKIFSRFGKTPTPPYVKNRQISLDDYQTVYARHDGSVAAPTAGLHFTEELLEGIRRKGVFVVPVTLRVGLGTFLPVKNPQIDQHRMHEEWYRIEPETAHCIQAARQRNHRIIAVGTTVVRALESGYQHSGEVVAEEATTDLFIRPGYHFRAVDGLITNFHLPRSTLYILVSAFCGLDLTRRAYQEAIDRAYRFYSFGDACLIL